MKGLARLALLFVVACAARAPTSMLLPAPRADEYAAYAGEGPGVIAGQAFLTTLGGDVKLAAGREVTLDPATTYAREWYTKYGKALDRFNDVPPSSEFRAARRSTIADAEGRFRFEGLPPGGYIVRTTVTWHVGGQVNAEGGVVSDVVSAGKAKATNVILSTASLATRDVYQSAATSSYSPAKIVSSSEIGSRQYESLGKVTGISCGLSATEEQARADLSNSAGKMQADGVIDVLCNSDFSVFKKCLSFVECVGEAIYWK